MNSCRPCISFENHTTKSSSFPPKIWKYNSTLNSVIRMLVYVTLKTGMLSEGGSVTDRNSSNEKTSPKKCERIVFAEACTKAING